MMDPDDKKAMEEQFQGLFGQWLDLSIKDKHPDIVLQYQEGFRGYFQLMSHDDLSQKEAWITSALGNLVMAQGMMFQQRLIDLHTECAELRARVEELEAEKKGKG